MLDTTFADVITLDLGRSFDLDAAARLLIEMGDGTLVEMSSGWNVVSDTNETITVEAVEDVAASALNLELPAAFIYFRDDVDAARYANGTIKRPTKASERKWRFEDFKRVGPYVEPEPEPEPDPDEPPPEGE